MRTHFLTVAATVKANAVGIHGVVMTVACKEANISREGLMMKMDGLRSDRAAVMQGKKGGVVAILQKDQPAVISVCFFER